MLTDSRLDMALTDPARFMVNSVKELEVHNWTAISSVISVALRLPEHAFRAGVRRGVDKEHLRIDGGYRSFYHPDAIALDEMSVDSLIAAGCTTMLRSLVSQNCDHIMVCSKCFAIHEVCTCGSDANLVDRRCAPGLRYFCISMAAVGKRVRLA